ncbi:hypothetical protein [Austwickia chelonae]|uniref:hypothetical protein n=1 Tax=Austwickia chelonae TaxID=100225 RepID=UPI000E287692|nr:hypothetical protein [Austwickia chelonae]
MIKSGSVVTAVAAIIGFSTLWMVSAQPQSLTYNLGPVTLGLTPAVLYVFGMLTAALLGLGIWQLQRGVMIQRRGHLATGGSKAPARTPTAPVPSRSVDPAPSAAPTPGKVAPGSAGSGSSGSGAPVAGAKGVAPGKPAEGATPKGGSTGAGS